MPAFGCPLVPVHEWMVLADVKQVGGSHSMERLCAGNCPPKVGRRRDRRFQSSKVAKATRPAVQLDFLGVDFQNLVEREKQRIHAARLVGEFFESFGVTLVRCYLCSLELLASLGRFGGCDDEPMPVSADVERRIGIDFQQFENRSVNHQCQTVSVLRKLLDQTTRLYTHCMTIGYTN